jgi:predicted HicB family RNase H-like nuclease
MATKAKLECNARWDKKQDKHLLRMKPGQKEKIKAHADSLGMSVNEYINKLIEQDMLDNPQNG